MNQKTQQPLQRPEEEIKEKIADASKTIFSFCMAKTSNRTDAEDLCQDILLELVLASGNIRDSRAFYGFMWAVAGNVYKQWCRKRAKTSTCELTEEIPSEESVLDRVLAGQENNDLYLLRRELALLSEKYRQAVILYYIDQKSCSQIAQALSVSESRVKYLLFKSRKILKEGMSMDRKPGALSCHPKDFFPMYQGGGPDCFSDFMQGKVRQNIVAACYRNALTPEGISLETGIPLPYLDHEISSLLDKKILVKEGGRCRANVIILTGKCADLIVRSAAPYHQKIAVLLKEFLESGLPAFRQIGFAGSGFSRNTLRWQLASFFLRECAVTPMENAPVTAWGDRAYLWLAEQDNGFSGNCFRICALSSCREDRIRFADYLPSLTGNCRDFCGRDHRINILCDIAHGDWRNFSEYDEKTAAELIRKGYLRKERNDYTVTMPVFTQEQYSAACRLAKDFISEKLEPLLEETDRLSHTIIGRHTPGHLRNQTPGVESAGRLVNAGCIPLSILVKENVLSTDWTPGEMPGMQICL